MKDLIYTLGLFMGGFGKNPHIPIFGSKPTSWQYKLNKEFIKRATGDEFKPRVNKVSDLSDDEVHSGDFLAIDRFDGLDQII